MINSLVQPLFDGPVDVVGDVHGEIAPLRSLMQRLGYSHQGEHPEGRRLIFVGDLVDRGPDSPAVLRLVMPMVSTGRAQCVLGNHELNLLLGRRKHGNSWYFAEEEPVDRHGRHMPQVPMDDLLRGEFDDFLKTLPLALEREDLRVVHACWHEASIAAARGATDTHALFTYHDDAIVQKLDAQATEDRVDRDIARQNLNPVKVLTSGLEEKAEQVFEAGGKRRLTQRTRWWNCYGDAPFVVFGHYWRVSVLGKEGPAPLFDNTDLYAVHGSGQSMCIDYSVGGRWIERQRPEFCGRYGTSLAALRWPERELWLDNGVGAICLNGRHTEPVS